MPSKLPHAYTVVSMPFPMAHLLLSRFFNYYVNTVSFFKEILQLTFQKLHKEEQDREGRTRMETALLTFGDEKSKQDF